MSSSETDPHLQLLLEGIGLVAFLLASDASSSGKAKTRFQAWEERLRQPGPELQGAPLCDLLARYHFNSFELKCLMLALSSHVEPEMQALIQRVSENAFSRRMTVGLALSHFCESPEERLVARQSFLPTGPLIKAHILALGPLQFGEGKGLLSREIELTTPAIRFLLDEQVLTDTLAHLVDLHYPTVDLFNVILPHDTMAEVRQLVSNHRQYRRAITDWGFDQILPYGRGLTFLFSGPPGTGKTLLAHALAAHVKRPILSLSGSMLPEGEGVSQVLELLLTEAQMRDAIVLIDECDALLQKGDKRKASTFKAIEAFDGILILVTNHPHVLDEGLERRIMYQLSFEMPSPEIRRQIWEVHLPPEVPLTQDIDLDVLANTYDFTGGTIKNAILFAVNQALVSNPKSPELTMAHLEAGCRSQLRYALEDLTLREESHLRLKDIVLQEKQDKQIREILAACKNQSQVLNTWGFGKKLVTGKGITCLFDGPPGTGKTLAAEIISGELERPLYRINIPEVVSKWVGDTEKNIRAIFQEARISHAMLLFDEADSLFASRVAESTSSSDRYANMEVNLLLQEIERFPGIVILTTNFYGSLDKALIRRLQFRVSFEEPDALTRKRIWETLCPTELPLAEDVDFHALAKNYDMTGGMIKNALLRAAYLSCEGDREINQARLEESCLSEYQAAGKVARSPEFREQNPNAIPEGAIPLPPDWAEKGIPPELMQQLGLAPHHIARAAAHKKADERKKGP